MPKALLIGHNGQDGVCLTRQLQAKGYTIRGVGRSDSGVFDIGKFGDMRRLISAMQPDEIYYLAAFHHSSEDPPIDEHALIAKSLEVNTLALNNVLGAVAQEANGSRVFYASSSRVFGSPMAFPQNEDTPLRPACAYGISKVAGMDICAHYRTTRKVFASAGILYNHESPLRQPKFISRKIVQAAVRIAAGSQEKLVIGSLAAKVDWGYAPDYTRAIWQILKLDQPADFVIGTGVLHSVQDFVEAAFAELGLSWREHVTENPNFLARKGAPVPMLADSSKLRAATGWQPEVDFFQMVRIMIEAETATLAGAGGRGAHRV